MGVLSENNSLRFLLVVGRPSVSQVSYFWRFERNDYISSSFLSNFYYSHYLLLFFSFLSLDSSGFQKDGWSFLAVGQRLLLAGV